MKRVFLLEDPKHVNVIEAGAGDYGDIVVLFDSTHRRPGIFSSDEFIAAIEVRLEEEEFGADDYFLIAGSVVAQTLAVVALCRRQRTLNLLLFDSTSSRYVHRAVDASPVAA